MPPMTLATTPQASRYVAPPRSVSQPTTYAATGQPSRNPTEGEAKTPRPPRRPRAAAGPRRPAPAAAPRERKPRRAPRTAPASITPSDWAVIGHGDAERVDAGISPSAATTAANVATSARSRDEERCTRGV